MKRRKFFGLLGKATAVLTITPAIIAEAYNSEDEIKKMIDGNFEEDLLDVLFHNQPITAPQGSIYVQLLKTNPEIEGGVEEVNYKGYVQGGVEVPRTREGWTISANRVTNTNRISFGACTGRESKIGWFRLCDHKGDMIYQGRLNRDLPIIVGETPEFSPGGIEIIEG